MDLEKLHKKAAKRKNSFVETRIEKTLHDICRNPKVKAPIRYLMSGLVAKMEKPHINLRKPTTLWEVMMHTKVVASTSESLSRMY